MIGIFVAVKDCVMRAGFESSLVVHVNRRPPRMDDEP